ncbi:uncharacterized protein [Nicotiana sylvestris]|uniref:uncharacterized protein n=1 Tax=Nicotiana sylvestris TaxID=4096 RepID=UPI00388C3DD1
MDELRELILKEAHSSRYSIHPGSAKIYQDLRQYYWWRRMKKDVLAYVVRYLNCQQVIYEHQRPGGLLQRLEIPKWKWEAITMAFVVGLPQTQNKFNAIWVIVDSVISREKEELFHYGYTSRGSLDQFLPLAEFTYNNNYQSSIQMALYEVLYGRRYCLPVGWFKPGEARLLGADLVQDSLDKVKIIQDRLCNTQSRQKSYADHRVRDVAFIVGERVLLQV